jgi:hypothetical protein
MTRAFTSLMFSALIGLTAPWLTACGMLEEDDVEACAARYHLQFIDDKNLSFADAFDHEVEDLTLYVYGPDGTLVTTSAKRVTPYTPLRPPTPWTSASCHRVIITWWPGEASWATPPSRCRN